MTLAGAWRLALADRPRTASTQRTRLQMAACFPNWIPSVKVATALNWTLWKSNQIQTQTQTRNPTPLFPTATAMTKPREYHTQRPRSRYTGRQAAKLVKSDAASRNGRVPCEKENQKDLQMVEEEQIAVVQLVERLVGGVSFLVEEGKNQRRKTLRHRLPESPGGRMSKVIPGADTTSVNYCIISFPMRCVVQSPRVVVQDNRTPPFCCAC